jgi:uncharacterized membrane protein HdeD (DUF308 family)
MVNVLARNWWMLALRGLAALVFGLLTLFNPAITLGVLVLFFGAYALVYGMFTIFAAVANRKGERYWVALLAGGILSVVIGALTFLRPGVTAIALLYLIAAWAIVTGLFELIAGIRLRKVITNEWLLILSGVLSVAFGIALVIFPGAGALAVTLWIGAYATAIGILLIALAFRLRGWQRRLGADQTLPTA